MGDSLVFTWSDIAALIFFIAVWVIFAHMAEGTLLQRESLTSAMNRQREVWMHRMARRELRMIDTGIMTGLQQGTAFFASSCLIALGGCFALLGGSAEVITVLSDLPWAQASTRPMFEIKVLGLIVLLAYSFFKFAWSYRLFNYCSILIGAVPLPKEAEEDPAATEAAVRRAARTNILAGKHFNAGLRGIFFSIGYLGWFVAPAVFAATTLFILSVLVRRQFFSAARQAVIGSAAAHSGPGKGESSRPESQ